MLTPVDPCCQMDGSFDNRGCQGDGSLDICRKSGSPWKGELSALPTEGMKTRISANPASPSPPPLRGTSP